MQKKSNRWLKQEFLSVITRKKVFNPKNDQPAGILTLIKQKKQLKKSPLNN